MIDRISAEQFVRSFAGQSNLNVLSGFFCKKILRDGSRISQRIIHAPNKVRKSPHEFLRRNHGTEIVNAELVGRFLGNVKLAIAFTFKSD